MEESDQRLARRVPIPTQGKLDLYLGIHNKGTLQLKPKHSRNLVMVLKYQSQGWTSRDGTL